MKPGEFVLVEFPRHFLHGQRCEVARVEDLNLAQPGSEPLLAHTIWLKPPMGGPLIGLGLCHIAGTVEAQERRRIEAEEDPSAQGELLI